MSSKKIYFVDFTKPIEVYTDASAKGIGGVAFQRDGGDVDTGQQQAQERQHPCSFRKVPDEKHEPPTVEEILEAQNSDQFMIQVRDELQEIRIVEMTALREIAPKAFRDTSDINHLICVDQTTSST